MKKFIICLMFVPAILLFGCSNYVPNITLWEAVVQQNEKDVKVHLKNGEKVNIMSWEDETTLLMLAVKTGNLNITKRLIKAGAF